MDHPPRRLDRQLIVRFLGTLGSLALLVYLLSQQGWGEIVGAFRRIPPISLAAVVGLLLLSRLAITARWYSLLRTADRGIPFRESLRLTLAGLFAANFLPTTIGGDVVRLAGVLRLSQNRAASAASIVADRLIGMAGMLMILPVGVGDLFSWLQAARSAGGPLALGLVEGEAPAGWRHLGLRLRRGLEKVAGAMRMWVHHPWALLEALGFTWIHMVCLFAEIWVLLRGMGEPASLLRIGGLWSLSYFVTLMPFSINGLGLREVSVTYIFSELGGISLQAALTLALILRTLDMLVSLPGAAFVSNVVAPGAKAPQGEA
jgi:uncharacterized membrane protein YbhN (UPF0104 family)